jgi:hypothetical protein
MVAWLVVIWSPGPENQLPEPEAIWQPAAVRPVLAD